MMFFIGNSFRETDEDEIEGDPDVGSKSILFVRRIYVNTEFSPRRLHTLNSIIF